LFTLLAIPVRLAAQRHPADSLSGLPLDAQPSVSAALGRDLPEYQAQARSGGFKAQNAQHKLAADFTSHGVAVRGENLFWRMAFSGYGYGVVLTSPQTVVPRAELNRVEYRRGSLTEWYVNGPAGLEQGFTITKPPGQANHRPLTIALSLSRDLATVVHENRTGLSLKAPDGKTGLRYTGLSATDAAGKKLPAWLELQGEQLLLRVHDTGAHYPVVIDPWVQLAELTASDGTSGDTFGASVSISGNTIVVGSPNSNHRQGAAYVFVRPASGWAKHDPDGQAYGVGRSGRETRQCGVDQRQHDRGRSTFPTCLQPFQLKQFSGHGICVREASERMGGHEAHGQADRVRRSVM